MTCKEKDIYFKFKCQRKEIVTKISEAYSQIEALKKDNLELEKELQKTKTEITNRWYLERCVLDFRYKVKLSALDQRADVYYESDFPFTSEMIKELKDLLSDFDNIIISTLSSGKIYIQYYFER